MKISDMMDHILDDTVDIQALDIASSDRIKEATMKRLHRDTTPHRRARRTSRVILIAALVALTLSVGAFAYAGFVVYKNPAAMLSAFFGENAPSQKEGVLEYDDAGELTVTLPGWERVPVDEALADELIAPYISAQGASIAWDGYTLTVEAHLYDAATQSGLIYYSIENPTGVSGYLVRGQSSLIFPEESISFSPGVDGGWTGADYIDAARTTETKLYVCRYYTACEWMLEGDERETGASAFIVRSNGGGETLGSAEIGCKNESGLAGLKLADGNIVVSPIALRVYNEGLGYGAVNDIKSVVLRYRDGTEYALLDNALFTDNSTSGLLDSVSTPARVTLTFNRIVDINALASVSVNGQDYAVTPNG